MGAGGPYAAVLLIDEVDTLVGDTPIAVLRHCAPATHRRLRFPQSVIPWRVCDVRDYRIDSDEGAIVTAGGVVNL